MDHISSSESVFSGRRQRSSDETAPTSISESSVPNASKTHRPILLSAKAIAIADGDARFMDLSYETPPPLCSFAIEASHSIIKSWPTIRSRIMIILDKSKIKWSSLGVLRRRQTLERGDDDTTVILVVEKGNEDGIVKSVEEDIYGVCKSTGNAGLFVEILEGRVTRFDETDYEAKASGGSSLSQTEVDYATGTLGGYIKLTETNGSSRVYGVSCHHVMMPTDPATPNKFSEAVKPDSGHYIRVSQPSVWAHGKTVRKQHELCESIEREISQHQVQGKDVPWIAGQLEMEKNVLRGVRDSLQKFIEFNQDFGTVFATSGYRISTRIGCSIDWALVDVPFARRGENKVPQLPRKPQDYVFLSEGNAVFSIAPLSVDDLVVKPGYATGVTYGRVSHIKHDCKLDGNDSVTSEYVVVGQKLMSFAQRGDSGAFVLNGRGRLVGLLIAGQEELNTAYVTPIEEVMRDIQDVTGQKVTLP